MIEPDYDADVEARRHTRTFREECAQAFSALDCVLNGEKAVYASSELTTGRRAFELAEHHGVRSGRELREKLGDDPHRSLLIERNMEEASNFARRLRAALGGGPVVTPAPFLAPGWTQAEYLHFWETLIRTRVSSVYFNEAWEYSTGCTFEFAVAREVTLPTFTADGRPLSLEEGIAKIEAAITTLEARGLDPGRLRLNLVRLHTLRVPIPAR